MAKVRMYLADPKQPDMVRVGLKNGHFWLSKSDVDRDPHLPQKLGTIYQMHMGLLSDEDIDMQTGAPARVREIVGGAPERDRLANLRRFYPEAVPYEGDKGNLKGNFVFRNSHTGHPTLYNPTGVDLGDVASATRDMAGILGGAAGATAGAVSSAPAGGTVSPVTTAVGAGLGTAIGHGAYDSIANAFRGRIDTRSLPEHLYDAAYDVASEGVGDRAGAIAGDLLERGIRRAARPIMKRLDKTPAGQLYRDYKMLDIDPSAATGAITGSRGVQLLERTLRKTPASAGIIERAIQKTWKSMGEAAEQLARDFGPVRTQQGAGEAIRKGYKGAVERFKTRSSELYDRLDKYFQPDEMVAYRKTQDFLNSVKAGYQETPGLGKRLNRGIWELQELLEEEAPGAIKFETLKRLRSDIGRRLGDPVSAVDDLPRADLKQLYAALSEDIAAAAKAKGGRAFKESQRASRYYRLNLKNNIEPLERILKQETDEQVFKIVMSGAKDGGTKLWRLKRSLRSEEWDMVAGTVLSRMGKAIPTWQDEAGELFSVRTFLRRWNDLSPEARTILFGGTRYKDLAPRLDALTRVVYSVRNTERMADHTSMAGNMATYLSLTAPFGGFAAGGVGGAAAGIAGAVIAPRVAARLITNPPFVQWLTYALKSGSRNPNWGPNLLGRLVMLAKKEDLEEEIRDYLSSVATISKAQAGETPDDLAGQAAEPDIKPIDPKRLFFAAKQFGLPVKRIENGEIILKNGLLLSDLPGHRECLIEAEGDPDNYASCMEAWQLENVPDLPPMRYPLD